MQQCMFMVIVMTFQHFFILCDLHKIIIILLSFNYNECTKISNLQE